MYQHILVPVDGSTTSDRALQEALGLARQQSAQLELVHVVEDIRLWIQTAISITMKFRKQKRAWQKNTGTSTNGGAAGRHDSGGKDCSQPVANASPT